MSRNAWSLGSIALAVGLLSSSALAQNKFKTHRADEEQQQESRAEGRKDAKSAGGVMCVVMTDKPIDKKHHVKYQGKEVYFCCARCKAKFEKDPTPYEEAVKAQWAAMKPLRVQVKCPNDDKPVDKAVFVKNKDYDEIHFCCKDCKAAWDKDSKAMRARLDSCFTYQTECPVEGGPIDPTASTEYQGKTIYLCCADCIDKFKADPAKYLGKVDALILANKAAQQERESEEKEAKGGRKPAGGDKPVTP